jgi:hypothetical protein
MFPGNSEYNYKPPIGSSINWNHQLSQGLIACYIFNEISTIRCYDLSIYSGFGTLTNGATYNPTSGGTIFFDGVNDYIAINSPPAIISSELSIEVWVRTSITTQTMVVGSSGGGIYINRFTTTGKVLAFFDGTTSNNSAADESNISVNDNKWHCIIATNKNNVTSLYIDGKLDKQYSDTLTFINGTNYLGTNFGAGQYYSGNISKFSLYNRALSDEEIKSLYENPYQFVSHQSSYTDYSYRQQNILFIPSIQSQESMGSAILPGPISIHPNSIDNSSDLNRVEIQSDNYFNNKVLNQLRFDSNLKTNSLYELPPPQVVGITVFGTTGSTEYSYIITANNKYGESLGSQRITINNGNSLLDTDNFLRITWNKVKFADSYKIYGKNKFNETFIAEVKNLHYDDIGLIPNNILPPFKNTTGYDHKKLNLGIDYRLNTGKNYDDNFVSAVETAISRYQAYNYRFEYLIYTIDWNEYITWVFTIENRNWTGRVIQALFFDKRINEFKIIGILNYTLPGPGSGNNYTVYDFIVSYEKINNSYVNVTGSSITGLNTSWFDEKIVPGCRIGFGSREPEYISTWYTISEVIDNTSITILEDAGVILNSTYVIEEMKIFISQRNTQTTNLSGLYVLKGIKISDFTPGGDITIPAATTLDRRKACYFLRDAPTGTLIYTQSIAMGEKIDNNTQYIYLINSYESNQTINNIVIYNVRKDLVNISSGITQDATLVVSSTFTFNYNANQHYYQSITLYKPKSGLYKNKNVLIVPIYDRTFYINVDSLLYDKNVIIYDYARNALTGGISSTGTYYMSRCNYLPEEDLFFGSSNGPFVFAKYEHWYSEALNLFPMTYFFTPNYEGYSYEQADFFEVAGYGARASDRYIYYTNGRADAFNGILYAFNYGADSLFCKKYNNYAITPSISTENAFKLDRLYINSEEVKGSDKYGFMPDAYYIYARTLGIEDNTGTWFLVDKTGDLSFLKPTDKIQFKIESKTLGNNYTPKRFYELSVTYIPFGDINDNFEWNLSNSNMSQSILAFKQTKLIPKQFYLTNSIQYIEIKFYDNESELLSIRSDIPSTDGVFQYFSNGSWISGFGPNYIGTLRRIVLLSNLNYKKVNVKLSLNDNILISIEPSLFNIGSYDEIKELSDITASSQDLEIKNSSNKYISLSNSMLISNKKTNKSFSGLTFQIVFKYQKQTTETLLFKKGTSENYNNYKIFIDVDQKIKCWFSNSGLIETNGKLQNNKYYHLIISVNSTNCNIWINNYSYVNQNINISLIENDIESIYIGDQNLKEIYLAKIFDKSIDNEESSRLFNYFYETNNLIINGLVRKNLPSYFGSNSGTVSINNTTGQYYIQGVERNVYFYMYNKFSLANQFPKRVKSEYKNQISFYESYYDNYTTSFSGYFKSQESGSYTFTISGVDDYAELYFGDNALTITSPQITSNGSFNISLQENTYYPIKVLQNEGSGGSGVTFSFSGPNISTTQNGENFYFSIINDSHEITGNGYDWSTSSDFNTLIIGNNDPFEETLASLQIYRPQNEKLYSKNKLLNNLSGQFNYYLFYNLALYLDASEYKSYPENGNVWYDLSGNENHFSIVGDVKWSPEGYFTNFKENSYIQIIKSEKGITELPNKFQEFTFFIVTKATSQTWQFWGINHTLFVNGTYTNNRTTALYLEVNTNRLYVHQYNSYIFNQYAYMPNKFHTFAHRRQNLFSNINPPRSMFIDGINLPLNDNTGGTIEPLFETFKIGASWGYPAGSPFLDGRIYAFLAFDRALSDSEILELHNYYKDKFNF